MVGGAPGNGLPSGPVYCKIPMYLHSSGTSTQPCQLRLVPLSATANDYPTSLCAPTMRDDNIRVYTLAVSMICHDSFTGTCSAVVAVTLQERPTY